MSVSTEILVYLKLLVVKFSKLKIPANSITVRLETWPTFFETTSQIPLSLLDLEAI